LAEQSGNKEYLDINYQAVGYPKPGMKKQAPFASCLRIVDPFSFETVYLQEFENNETVMSVYVSNTMGMTGQVYLFLGVGLEATLQKDCKAAEIQTYSFTQDGSSLQFLYRTSTEHIPTAFSETRGRLMVGVGSILRVYEMGQKKLLRKYDNRNFKSQIIKIECKDNKIFVGDVQQSVHVVKFRPDQGQLYIFADDVLNRYLTSFCLLDDDTVAGVDKFENFFVNRLPVGCEEDAEDDPSASK